MPCIVNPNILSPPPPVAGDLTITRGTQSHDDRGVINYWYRYSTGLLFIPYTDLTAIPDGVTINKIAFQYDLTLAPGGQTYSISNTYGWIYLQSDQSFSGFPNSMLNNGLATSNTTFNNGIVNYTDFLNGPTTYSFTQQTSDPNIRYVDIPFVNNMQYKAGHSLCIAIVNNSGNYTGTQVTPGWLGDTSTHSLGKQFGRQNNDTSGPYSITGSTTSFDNTFRPNIKIYWT
jgi:hypothetical protein